jgi:hypothetical protein
MFSISSSKTFRTRMFRVRQDGNQRLIATGCPPLVHPQLVPQGTLRAYLRQTSASRHQRAAFATPTAAPRTTLSTHSRNALQNERLLVIPGSSLSQPQNISAFVSSLTTPTSYSASAVESPPTWASGDDNQLPSSRPVLERLCPRCVPSCICAWQTRAISRPPGLSRERDRKPAISITGKKTGDTHSKPAISIAGIGAGPRRSSADIDRLILQDLDMAGLPQSGSGRCLPLRRPPAIREWGIGSSRFLF